MDLGGIAQGSEAQACGEPDDARRARESEEECAEHCRIENGALVGDCAIIAIDDDGIATLDVGQVDGLVMRMEICDPRDTVLESGYARVERRDRDDPFDAAGDVGIKGHERVRLQLSQGDVLRVVGLRPPQLVRDLPRSTPEHGVGPSATGCAGGSE